MEKELHRYEVTTRTGRNPVIETVIAYSGDKAILSVLSRDELDRRAATGPRVPVRDLGPASKAEVAQWQANYDAKTAAYAALRNSGLSLDEVSARLDEIEAMP